MTVPASTQPVAPESDRWAPKYVLPSSPYRYQARPPEVLSLCSTVPLTGATVGTPRAAIMSTPWWVWPERAAPKESTNETAPSTGHTMSAPAARSGAGGGGGGAVVVVVVGGGGGGGSGGAVVGGVLGRVVVVVPKRDSRAAGPWSAAREADASANRVGAGSGAGSGSLPVLPMPAVAATTARLPAISVGIIRCRRMGRVS